MIKLYQSSDSQYYFTVCGKNGEVILTSELYTKKGSRNRAVNSFNKKLITPLRVIEKVFDAPHYSIFLKTKNDGNWNL